MGSGVISRFGVMFGMGSGVSVTTVLNVSDVTTISVIYMVSHSLQSTIRQQNMLFAVGNITITSFMVSKIGSSIVIENFVLIGVVSRYVMVAMRGVVRGVMAVRYIS